MEKVKSLLYFLFGRVYIPEKIFRCNEDILLHISDTPSNFYPGLKMLIRELRPKIIVHTGDLVDNIKLELYPDRRHIYTKKVNQLINMLESSCAEKVYLALGNHDDKPIVKNCTKRSIVVEGSRTIVIVKDKYKISHFFHEIIKAPEKYNLFGHDLAMPSKTENDRVYLNGITGINIIALGSKSIFTLPYPYGTNDDRMCKSNIGF